MSTLTHKAQPSHITRGIAIGAVAVLGSGCAGGDTGQSPPESRGTEVTATETDFKIELSQDTFAPGTYTFVARNDGQATHALQIEGNGVEETTETIGNGESATFTVTLEAGSYELYCPVANHRDLGMTTEITVGDATGPTGPTNGTTSDGGGY